MLFSSPTCDITSKYYVWAITTFTSFLLLPINRGLLVYFHHDSNTTQYFNIQTNAGVFYCCHGNPMVLPVLSAKRETTYRSNERKTNSIKLSTIGSTTAATTSVVPILFLIHLFPALTCNYIPSITLVLSKQTTLQPNSPWPLRTMTMTTVSRTVSKKEFHESTTATMTTTASAPSLLRIHSFPALACNCTPGITLVLSKLVSLASNWP